MSRWKKAHAHDDFRPGESLDVKQVPNAERLAYGDTAFGRGCLAAVRLVQTGVRWLK